MAVKSIIYIILAIAMAIILLLIAWGLKDVLQ